MELAHLNTLSLEGRLHAQPGKDQGPTLLWLDTSGCCCDSHGTWLAPLEAMGRKC